jgi:hypothetical protein
MFRVKATKNQLPQLPRLPRLARIAVGSIRAVERGRRDDLGRKTRRDGAYMCTMRKQTGYRARPGLVGRLAHPHRRLGESPGLAAAQRQVVLRGRVSLLKGPSTDTCGAYCILLAQASMII